MFLIDNSIYVFNCSINSSAIFIDTPLPLRPTSYIDEVQRFLRVSPKYIKGIEIPLYNILNSIDEETSISKLNSLKTIISNINELPIYDYSDLNNIKEINKEDCLKLL